MIIEEFLQQVDDDADIHEFIESVRDEDENATASQRNRDYAEGRFEPTITSEQREIIGGNIDEELDPTENVIGKSRDQIASRIRLRGFKVEDNAVSDFLEDFFVRNRLTKEMIAVAKRQMTDGSAALSVSWQNGRNGKPGRAVVHTELWWDGKSGIFVSVDDTNQTQWAVSEWEGRNEVHYRTLYLDDRIIRYVKEGQGWDIEKEIDWVRPDGTPLGVPVAHFPNGESGYSPYPPSTVGQVVAAQDALNRTLFFRQAASALTGMQVYWATGVKEDDDNKVHAGELWTSQNPDAKFGSIAAGSLEALHMEVDDLRTIISGAFPVPSYRISRGDWPSGLALQRADAPMLAQSMQLIEVDKAGAVLIAHRAVELHNAFGSGAKLNEKARIEADFESPESVDPGTQVEVDQALVDLYAALDDLPEALIEATNILDSDVLEALISERKESLTVMADAMSQADSGEDEDAIDG